MKFIRQKERLILHELRKYFEERRRKKDEDFMGIDDVISIINNHDSRDSKESAKIDIFADISPAHSIVKFGVILYIHWNKLKLYRKNRHLVEDNH